MKQRIEKITVDFAKKHYSFNYDLLFCDVTTLYFETFEEDELRKNGLKAVTATHIVAIHDGVRPLVSQETIARCFSCAEERGSIGPFLITNGIIPISSF